MHNTSTGGHFVSVSIVGLSCATPLHAIAQQDAARQAAEITGDSRSNAIAKLYQQTGVQTRHSVLLRSSTNGEPAEQHFYRVASGESPYGPTTGERMRRYEADATELMLTAARRALENAGTDANEIRQLVTVSCSGFAAPGVDVQLIEQLPLSPSVGRTHVGFMGCHGAMNGLRVAKALAESGDRGPVLLCCVELCSLHHQYQADAQQVVANALFADGAAAMVLQPELSSSWQVIGQRSVVLPASQDAMSWRIGDHGFEMTLSPRVPELIQSHTKAWVTDWLASQGLRLDEVRSWAIHPGGPRILAACADALELSDDALRPSREILAEFGNMSSPTLLFVLQRLRNAGAALPCVALAFGPGLTIEAALFGHLPSGENANPG
jgi:predicted naringenin-chalcone synthase